MTEGCRGCRIHSRPGLPNCTVRLRSRPSRSPRPAGAMTTKLKAILFSILVAVSSFAQEPTITIQKSAELVTIPVLVTDKSGKPVHGLTRQDFTVTEDGKTT